MTEFEIDAIFNTICRPGQVVKILTKYISCNGGPGILQGSGYQQAFCFTPPKVFRFPADDEVEV